MSFKREGDDLSLLNNLKQKRVCDLLGEHVPEDEAKLLSNGRLTCLICNNRPIFDNMKMLILHRKGKKHLQELSFYLSRKSELEFAETKRKQKEQMLAEKHGVLGGGSGLPNRPGKKIALDLSQRTNAQDSSRSSASQVRRYLKQISKQPPLAEKVYKSKETNPPSVHLSEASEQCRGKEKPFSKDCITPLNKSSRHSAQLKHENAEEKKRLFQLHMSGWIRDKCGNMVKDPDAEFDSDD